MVLQFNVHKTLYQVLYMNRTSAMLYPRFMEKMNKGNIIKHIYSWKKRDSEWGSGSPMHTQACFWQY